MRFTGLDVFLSHTRHLHFFWVQLVGLEHSITAPVTTHRSLFLEGEGMAFSRSLTQRRDSPRRNLILDRLSEREKVNVEQDIYISSFEVPII